MSEERNTEYKMNMKQWLENFWYHYKWHTVVALFLIFTITICSFQFCQRKDYDIYIMYAGGGELKMTSQDGDVPEYEKAISALLRYTDDYDENGEIAINLLTLFMPSSEEIENIKADGKDVAYQKIYDNSQIFRENILYSDYYLCLLSEEIFLEQCASEAPVFDKISQYTQNGTDYEFVSEYGIRLSSLPIYARDGIKTLPRDTVVCIRCLSEVSSRLESGHEQSYINAGILLRELLKK